jgi:NAD(P)-dependent dehydrogenase (short-subunit alcohol dehydrogenase family)
MTSQKVAAVTGSSSGMGFETSLALARNGFYTYATMRKLEGQGSKQIIDIAKNENLPSQNGLGWPNQLKVLTGWSKLE